MTLNAAGIEVPQGTDPFDPDGDMREMGLSLASRVIVPVANTAGRAAIESAVAARPLYVHRDDAGAGRQLEVKTATDAWQTVAAESDAGWVGLLGVGGWGGDAPQGRVLNGVVYLRGDFKPLGSGTVAFSAPQMGNLPAAIPAPTRTLTFPVETNVSGQVSIVINSAGVILLRAHFGAPTYSPTSYFALDGCRWLVG